jgi:flagellar biosynthesis protein FlhB
MRKKLLTTKEIKRYIKTHDTIEEILYCLVFFLVPFVFYLAAHFKYLFDYVDDELQVYLEAEKRYSAATRIWLLAIIAILLVILIVKI